MAWLSSTWRRRESITIVTDSTASTRDVEAVVPNGWDEFWDAIDANGYNIRVTGADGVTPIVYRWTGFNKTNRVGTIQLESVPTPTTAGRAVLIWLYFSAAAVQADGAGAVTVTSGLTGYIERGSPVPAQTFRVVAQPPGNTIPTRRIGKLSSVSTFVWLDFGEALEPASGAYNGSLAWEEPSVANVAVLDTSAAAVASMTADADMRWVTRRVGTRERIFLRLRLKAGATANRYTLVGQFQTSTPNAAPHRVIEDRIGIDVRDLLET